MLKYSDMCNASETARKEFFAFRDRCWGYLSTVLKGLESHCEVPPDQITFLKWNELPGEARRYSKLEGGGEYTFPGAATYDKSDGFWHLGVRIYLNPPNHLPRQFVGFVLCASEQNGSPIMKTGINTRGQLVHLDVEAARNAYCEDIAKSVIEAYSDPRKPNQKTIGFDVASM